MYSAIFVIVDRGKAEEVVDAAKAAGARGATIMNARGSGIHETQLLFNMEIEPEKEIVLILAQKDIVEPIAASIREKMKLDEPGNGILFLLDVNKTYGIR
jgi:nitrogen regulatory protein PII